MTTVPRRAHSGNAAGSKVTSQLGTGDTDIPIQNTTGWPDGSSGDYFAVINRGKDDEEKVLVTDLTGSSLTVTRAQDSTSAQTHAINATIEVCWTATEADESNAHISDTDRDDHTQYLNEDRHDIPERHTFGAAYGSPLTPEKIGGTGTEDSGSGDNPAKEDHIHELGDNSIYDPDMFADGVIPLSALGTSITAGGVIPAGIILPFAGPDGNIPSGYLKCDGTQYLNTDYPNLATALGTTWGGDGTHFKVPDLRGRQPIGEGAGAGLTSRALGATGGAEEVDLAVGNLPAHTHSIAGPSGSTDISHTHTGTTSSNGNHNHSIPRSDPTVHDDVLAGNFRTLNNSNGAGTTGSDGAHTHTFTTASGGSSHTHTLPANTGSVGSGDAVATMDPFAVVNFIIKT